MPAASDPAGYSGTPLAQKLGLKDGQRVLFIALPKSLDGLRKARRFLAVAQSGWEAIPDGRPAYDLIHAFTTERAHLERHGRTLMDRIGRDGSVWVSWPKKASKVVTDITEDVIREVLLPLGLVDVKVAAVDATWSGLKLVIRKELR